MPIRRNLAWRDQPATKKKKKDDILFVERKIKEGYKTKNLEIRRRKGERSGYAFSGDTRNGGPGEDCERALHSRDP